MNKDADEKADKPFKVQDNRRFEADGTERDNKSSNPASPPADAQTASPGEQGFILRESQDKESVGHPAGDGAAGGPEEVNFVSFMMSLATQGMMQLGEMDPPEGHPLQVNLEHAKQTIEILAMLQDKTKGNLDEFEQGLVEEVLHTLRMAFIARKGKS